MSLDDLLNLTRLVIHAGTVIVLCRYKDPKARYRPIVSITATLLAGLSAAAACYVLLLWPTSHQYVVTLIAAMVLVALVRARGNVAHMLRPRR